MGFGQSKTLSDRHIHKLELWNNYCKASYWRDMPMDIATYLDIREVDFKLYKQVKCGNVSLRDLSEQEARRLGKVEFKMSHNAIHEAISQSKNFARRFQCTPDEWTFLYLQWIGDAYTPNERLLRAQYKWLKLSGREPTQSMLKADDVAWARITHS